MNSGGPSLLNFGLCLKHFDIIGRSCSVSFAFVMYLDFLDSSFLLDLDHFS